MKSRLLVLIIAVALLGCASDVANRYYGDTRYPPKNVSEVELLSRKPSRPFTVIADFQSRNEGPEDMRAKAAQIGADAVIVSLLGGAYNRGEQWAGSDSMSNTYTHITGTAIVYK